MIVQHAVTEMSEFGFGRRRAGGSATGAGGREADLFRCHEFCITRTSTSISLSIVNMSPPELVHSKAYPLKKHNGERKFKTYPALPITMADLQQHRQLKSPESTTCYFVVVRSVSPRKMERGISRRLL